MPQFSKRFRHQTLVNFDDVKDRSVGIDALEVSNDFADRWLCTAEVKARLYAESIPPRWREKSHNSSA